MLALQLATMLGCAVLFGQIMRRFHQPAVLGEMLGGIVLGPTIFGVVAPDLHRWLFASSVDASLVRDASVKLGMLFFLFIAGSEIDLSDFKKVGRAALSIGLVGTLIPIGAGIALVYALPHDFWGSTAQTNLLAFAVFVGMNLANSANPVLARILMDLGLLKSPIGTLSMAATIVDDLINWTLFAIVLSTISPPAAMASNSDNLGVNIGLVFLLFLVILGGGRWAAPRVLSWLRAHVSWPSGFIAVIALLILVAASVSEAIGIHAFLGAFLVGAALGGHDAEHEEAHDVIARFSLSFFAPIYFISMGMTANFITSFDLGLVLVITVVAITSKLGAVLVGARLAGMPIDRDAWAVGFGLNARGATGIILASVGRTAGLIDDRMFVAFVVMALTTSLISGPMMSWLLSPRATSQTVPEPASAARSNPVEA